MSYQTIKDGIVSRLQGLGYAESSEVDNFEDASSNEYGNTFIIRLPEGELNADNETLMDRYRENQTWEIQVAFPRSTHNDAINRDELHRRREAIIKDLDDPTNHTFVFKMDYQSFTVEEVDNYFLLTLNFSIIDQVTY